MKKEDVTHRGVVKRAEGDSLSVITDEACSCDGCAVAALCNKAPEGQTGREAEVITVRIPDAGRFKPGDRVELTATSSSTLWATLWALVMPTVVFVGVLLAVRLGCPSTGDWSIAIAFAALAPYTAGLWAFRGRLAGRISWRVEKV